MFCRNCGTRLEEGALFCPQCGCRVEEEPIENISPDMSLESMIGKYAKSNSRKLIAAGIVIAVALAAVIGIPPLVQKMAVRREISKAEKAIETALERITEVEDFSGCIDVTGRTDSIVDGKSPVGMSLSVDADILVKNGRTHVENGVFGSFMMAHNNGNMHKEDYTFESYITEYNQVYSAKEDESFERVNCGFSKEDLFGFFEEVEENYKANPKYENDLNGDEITISGTLSDGYEIYNTYIDFLELALVGPEEYPRHGEMNYVVSISKTKKAVNSITFYLSDVWHILLGAGDPAISENGSNGEFTIVFKNFSEVEDFELPYFM